MKNHNQTIKCEVKNCQFNNEIDYLCTLDTINVSCSCNKENCQNKKETICDSFKKKIKE